MTSMKQARCVGHGLKFRRVTRSATAAAAAAALAAESTGEGTGSAEVNGSEAVLGRGEEAQGAAPARVGDPCNDEALYKARSVGLKYRRKTRPATAAARAAAAALPAQSRGETIGAAEVNGSEAVFSRGEEEAIATARGGDPCINVALPWDLIGQVLTKLDDLTNFGVARCVCKTWNEVLSSRMYRPPIIRMPLWCLMRFRTGWTNMDLVSGKEHRLQIPSTSTPCSSRRPRLPPGYDGIPKGQNGLISFVVDREYVVTNPLLNKWQAVPPSPRHTFCESVTHELVVVPSDRCGAGARSQASGRTWYKILKFMYVDPQLWAPRHINTHIYDSLSGEWSAGALHPHPPTVSQNVTLKSCVWSSVGGRINIVFLVVAMGSLYRPGAFERFSVWEYDVDQDTLTLKVPMAALPYDEHLMLGLLWQKAFSFQIQVREPDRVELVAALPRASPLGYPAVQVFLWDPQLARWCCRTNVEVDIPELPAGGFFSGWWRDLEDSTYSHTCTGGRLLMSPYDVCGNRCMTNSPSRGRGWSMRWELSAVRTDNLQEWNCEITVAVRDKMSSPPFSGFCYFPSLDALP